jgi:mono/diheme cytochrome c family protein
MKRIALLILLAIAAAPVASAAETTHPSKETYEHLCASCHGTDGKGDGPEAATLDPKPTDLTMLAKNHGGEFPTLKVAESIEGRTMIKAHGTASMPVWGKLGEQPGSRGPVMDVASLTNYLRSIQQK